MATLRSRRVFRAVYTLAHAARPVGGEIAYEPRRAPDDRAMIVWGL